MLPENFRRIRQNNNLLSLMGQVLKTNIWDQILDLDFFLSWTPDPGVIKAPDLGSRSTTLVMCCFGIKNIKHETEDGKTD
jgi:hypothetical protein